MNNFKKIILTVFAFLFLITSNVNALSIKIGTEGATGDI